ncbi:CDP-alcohol phosphatidyltransferase family protein [Humibacter sp. RRB41]|uniref:CDP-alcohol phosphatidyltransferase family protein n=1 Tax=Humibacter sp. RRB41 TaxID=2919946 RepID=UPI001FAA38DE|nr:CDP-alcohol phosphatidyltransferase family protein [Humibacter sp. RRB41]
MRTVHWIPITATAACIAGLALVHLVTRLPPAGWAAGATYAVVSNVLLGVGLHRRGATRVGWANVVTTARSTLVALITAIVAASFVGPIPVPLLVGLAIPALALDAVDGWVARRTGSASELGARYDMEVDAFLLMVLSAYVAQTLGVWVLAIGLMRYAFVAVGWALPWFRAQLPPRYWRKVVTAAQGIALTFAASGLLAQLAVVLVLAALLLLVESFGRDVVWLVRHRSPAEAPRALRYSAVPRASDRRTDPSPPAPPG